MTVRDTRLANDYQSLVGLCLTSDIVKIKILSKSGNPPDNYRISLSNCKGVASVSNGSPTYRMNHIITIKDFPRDYPDPGQIAQVKIEEQTYHPNIYSDGRFCFRGSDLATVDEPLDVLVKRVISMIQYENLRFGTPANSEAKTWANANTRLFPLAGNLTVATQSTPKQIKWG